MPNFKEHYNAAKFISIFTGIITLVVTQSIPFAILSVLNTIFSSLYPDTDIKSTAQRIVLLSLIIISGFAFLIKIPSYPLIIGISAILILIPMLSKHRGITHNFIYGFFLQACLITIINILLPGLLTKNIATFALILSGYVGFATHLILDFNKH